CRSPAELALMQTLKQALDPQGILNPGRVLPR
ncbi:MAG: FAD-linked oxidase C-terminal domain-containing protein, partial [Steroidobacteraceae bacterium]